MTNSYTAVMCLTSSGQFRIFAIDSEDAVVGDQPYQADDYIELTDIITGNSLGDSLQNQSIVRVMATTENFTGSPNGIVFIDNQNNVVGSVSPINPESMTPQWVDVSIPVQLNYTCKVITTAAVL